MVDDAYGVTVAAFLCWFLQHKRSGSLPLQAFLNQVVENLVSIAHLVEFLCSGKVETSDN
jgi:hypothetical protein